MRKRKRSEDDFDFLKEEGMLGKRCSCKWADDPNYTTDYRGCPIHDPLYHERGREKDPKAES